MIALILLQVGRHAEAVLLSSYAWVFCKKNLVVPLSAMDQEKLTAKQLAWDWELYVKRNFRQVYCLYRREHEWFFLNVKNISAFPENGKSSPPPCF